MPNTLDPNNAIPTTLQESVNIVLSVLGEAPVNSLTGTTASLGLSIIEEVSTDIQSKGWWFNQQTSSNFDPAANIIIYPSNSSSNWHANIPEEARRYITIRAARIAHTRLIGTEDNFKFSFQEEQVSLAILQQAHVRNSNSDLSFSSYPSDLKNLGIDEYIFLQSNLEEKLGTLKLATTLKEQTILDKQATKLDEEIDLLEAQDTLVTAQAQTEGAQQLVLSTQAALNQDIEAKTVSEKNLIEQQKLQLVATTAKAQLEGSIEKNYYERLTSNTINAVTTYRTWGTALRMIGIQEKEFNALPVYKKREFLYNARKYNIAIATETGTDAFEIATVNKIMSLIGEAPVTALNTNAMASEAVRHLRRANDELQARGWWFNTEKDVEVTPSNSGTILWAGSWLNIEVNDVPTTKFKAGNAFYVRNLKTKSYNEWSGTQKATIIYKRDLEETPQKFQELLEVRVARLLTELYPQSGIDVQRLPKMEAELMTYFKDREFDQGNYSVFDNYDAAVRVGINRSYNLF
jgi:hypothetical protein